MQRGRRGKEALSSFSGRRIEYRPNRQRNHWLPPLAHAVPHVTHVAAGPAAAV